MLEKFLLGQILSFNTCYKTVSRSQETVFGKATDRSTFSLLPRCRYLTRNGFMEYGKEETVTLLLLAYGSEKKVTTLGLLPRTHHESYSASLRYMMSRRSAL